MARKTSSSFQRTLRHRSSKAKRLVKVHDVDSTSIEERVQEVQHTKMRTRDGGTGAAGTAAALALCQTTLHGIDTDECMCFLRRGQMFLPPGVLFDPSAMDQDHANNFFKRKVVDSALTLEGGSTTTSSLGVSQGKEKKEAGTYVNAVTIQKDDMILGTSAPQRKEET